MAKVTKMAKLAWMDKIATTAKNARMTNWQKRQNDKNGKMATIFRNSKLTPLPEMA